MIQIVRFFADYKGNWKATLRAKHNTLRCHLYSKLLNPINGINFSLTKLDIMYCLIHGKDAKSIAQLLSTEAKNIHNNISEINQKLNCGSKQSIIKIIEKSPQCKIMRESYQILLIESSFERMLEQISSQVREIDIVCATIYSPKKRKENCLINLLKKHLSMMGLKATIQASKDSQQLGGENKLQGLKDCQSMKDIEPVKETEDQVKIRIGNSRRNPQLGAVEAYEDTYLSVHANYFDSFIEFLERLIPQLKLDPCLISFKNQYSGIKDSISSRYSEYLREDNTSLKILQLLKLTIATALKNKPQLFWGINACLIIFSIMLI